MIEVHLRKLRARDDISDQEEQAIRGLISQVIEIPEDRTFIRHGEELHQSTLLLDGWLAREQARDAGEDGLEGLHPEGGFVGGGLLVELADREDDGAVGDAGVDAGDHELVAQYGVLAAAFDV